MSKLAIQRQVFWRAVNNYNYIYLVKVPGAATTTTTVETIRTNRTVPLTHVANLDGNALLATVFAPLSIVTATETA